MLKILLLDHLEACITFITEIKLVPLVLYRLRLPWKLNSRLQESATGICSGSVPREPSHVSPMWCLPLVNTGSEGQYISWRVLFFVVVVFCLTIKLYFLNKRGNNYFFLVGGSCTSCGISSQPGIEPGPLAVEILTTGHQGIANFKFLRLKWCCPHHFSQYECCQHSLLLSFFLRLMLCVWTIFSSTLKFQVSLLITSQHNFKKSYTAF